jgi:putative phage-type endonuclease
MIIQTETDLAQGSPEWLEARLTSIGSSEIGTILGINTYQTADELFLIKTKQKAAPDLSNNYFVKRGQALEPLARNIFNIDTESNYEPVVFTSREHPYFKYSSDGYNEKKNALIEVKSMMKKNHELFVSTKKPSESYRYQCLWGLMISKCEVLHFIAYNPEYEQPIHSIEIYPDQFEFDYMTMHALEFQKRVSEYINNK